MNVTKQIQKFQLKQESYTMGLPMARQYNAILTQLPESSRKKHMLRDLHTSEGRQMVMHTSKMVPAHPPTIEERILGQTYLEMRAALLSGQACLTTHKTFAGHTDEPEEEGTHICTISQEEFKEAYLNARNEIEEYNRNFGLRDSNNPNKPSRKWRLGDKVQYPRHSSDDLSSIYDEIRERRENEEYEHPRNRNITTLRMATGDNDPSYFDSRKNQMEPAYQDSSDDNEDRLIEFLPNHRSRWSGKWVVLEGKEFFFAPWSFFDQPVETPRRRNITDITALFEQLTPRQQKQALKNGFTVPQRPRVDPLPRKEIEQPGEVVWGKMSPTQLKRWREKIKSTR